MRTIDDVLHFRSDLSPFLVHLTRNRPSGPTARQALEALLNEGRLRQGGYAISDARFGIRTDTMDATQIRRFFGAVSLTETPVAEIHCLFEIQSRSADFQPYGLVFVKDQLLAKGVEPVIYVNNTLNDKNNLVRSLCSLIEAAPTVAEELLPLVAVFGTKLTGPGAAAQNAVVDFTWEREWRRPFVRGDLPFDLRQDVFMGLCPDNEIDFFESLVTWPKFIDPRRAMTWYAQKLISARQAFNLKTSVV